MPFFIVWKIWSLYQLIRLCYVVLEKMAVKPADELRTQYQVRAMVHIYVLEGNSFGGHLLP